MKAVAKRDIENHWNSDYTNFITGNKYDFKEYPEIFQTHITDEKGNVVQYCGGKESLYEMFDFMEE